MPVAEKVYEPLRIEVIPAGSDAPVLVKERGAIDFSPTKGGELVRVNRASPPVSLPPKQEAKFQEQRTQRTGRVGGADWKVKQPIPRANPKISTRVSPLINTEGGQALGSFLGGVIDELRNSSREHAYQHYGHLNLPGANRDFYDAGRDVTQWAEEEVRNIGNWAEDQLNNAWDFYQDQWDKLPDFGLPQIDLPSIKLPQFDLPKIDLPKIDLPEINLPDFGFPDWNLFNPNEQQDPDNPDDRDRQDRRKREEERKRHRDFQKESPADQIEKYIAPHIPDGCQASITFMKSGMATWTEQSWEVYQAYKNDSSINAHRFLHFATPINYHPGRGSTQIVDREYDAFGNPTNIYVYQRGSSGVGLPMLGYPFEIMEREYGYEEVKFNMAFYQHIHHGGITNKTKAGDLFKYSDGSYLDIGGYAIDSVRIYCDRRTKPLDRDPYIPYLEPLPDDPPPIPPSPLEPTMCDCADIAVIMRNTLKSMKFKVTVPTVSCEFDEDKNQWTPQVAYETLEVFAVDEATARSQSQVYLNMAMQARELCEAKNTAMRTAEAIGVDEYPASVPASLITKDEGLLDNQNPNIEIKNLTQLFGWFVERFDEIVGQWEIPIEIKDVDPTTPGDQSKKMKFPNLAEAIAEILLLLLQISINGEIITNVSTRLLMEAGQDKQQNLITYKLLQSLTDYIGYNYKEVPIEMPLLFNPNAQEFDKMLTEIKIKVAAPELDEKLNLQADLMRFRKASSILDSVYFRKIDTSSDIKSQLMKRIFDMRSLLKDLHPDQGESFKEFLEQVEKGFTDTPGIGDPAKPYGNDYEDRPRFRDLTEQQNPNVD